MTIQTDILSFVAQQAIAHAALIFATLTAAFGFASGFKPKTASRRRVKLFYGALLALLMTGAIYAGFRLYFYGQLAGAVLNYPPENDFALRLCQSDKGFSLDPSIPRNSTTAYWRCIVVLAYQNARFLNDKNETVFQIPLDEFGGVTSRTMLFAGGLGAGLAFLMTWLLVEESSAGESSPQKSQLAGTKNNAKTSQKKKREV